MPGEQRLTHDWHGLFEILYSFIVRVSAASWLTRTIAWPEPELWRSCQFQAVHRRANVEAACRKDSENGTPNRRLAHSYHAQLYGRQMQWYTIPCVLA